MLLAVPFALIGLALVVLRRPITRLILEWRAAFPPELQGGGTTTGEVFIALLGAFFLLLAVLAAVFS